MTYERPAVEARVAIDDPLIGIPTGSEPPISPTWRRDTGGPTPEA